MSPLLETGFILFFLQSINSIPQSIQLTPQIGGLPMFTPSIKFSNGDWSRDATSAILSYAALNAVNESAPQYKKSEINRNINQLEDKNAKPLEKNDYVHFDYSESPSVVPSSGPNYEDSKMYLDTPVNKTGRFFSLNTNTKTLDLGISFTVPFISLSMASLFKWGNDLTGATSGAIASLWGVNWASLIVVAGGIALAAFLIPSVAQWISYAISNVIGLKYGAQASSYGSYAYDPYTTGNIYSRMVDDDSFHLFPVSPFKALLRQIDEALEEFDIDSGSCMQRAVCNYVQDSEDSVSKGEPDSLDLIISGVTRSSVLMSLLGQTPVAKAVEVGRSGGSCKKSYTGCPFSIGGILKFLANYAAMAAT